jgi:hypothetical protein
MIRYKIEEICGDWAIYEVRETETEGGERCLLILNSRSNAEYVKAILEHEAQYPNAAVPYRPEVAQMSDAECVAVNRLCCTGGHQCHACPLSGSESLEETCFEVERRVNGLAEKYLESKCFPLPVDGVPKHEVEGDEKAIEKPKLIERIAEKFLLAVYMPIYCVLWFVVGLLRFPFKWIGKIDDVLGDAERGINRSVSVLGDAIAALTPECEWKYQYEKLKKRTETKSETGGNNEDISD